MFIRTKKINNEYYAYLVENKSIKNVSKQMFKSYLGKVHICDSSLALDFYKTMNIIDIEEYFKNTDFKDIINDLIRVELMNKNFKEINKNTFTNGEVVLSVPGFVTMKNKPVVIKSKDGFLCKYTIENILSFKPAGEDSGQDGLKLAERIVSAGINIDRHVFVRLFEKLTEGCKYD